jgi:hypothetical protein
MRKKQKIVHTSDLFGHNYSLTDGENSVQIATGVEQDWTGRQRRIKQAYWFRAPRITDDQLADTARGLENTDGRFQFDIWRNEDRWEASLKFEDEMDATTWAWSRAHYWQKWDAAQEKEYLKGLRSKANRARVTKDGRVRVTVQVSTLSD